LRSCICCPAIQSWSCWGETGGTPERIAQLRGSLGLNDPLPVQYGHLLWNALHGDLGRLDRTDRPVLQEIWLQAPSTIELTLAGLGFATVFGILLGVLAAQHPDSSIDRFCLILSLLGVSMPSFWLGMLLIFLFSLRLGWLPAMGSASTAISMSELRVSMSPLIRIESDPMIVSAAKLLE
jgi:peptide/nickel transport system permease protein